VRFKNGVLLGGKFLQKPTRKIPHTGVTLLFEEEIYQSDEIRARVADRERLFFTLFFLFFGVFVFFCF
jgi:hypothetical protein